MKYTIKVPDDAKKHVDITEVHVVSRSELEAFLDAKNLSEPERVGMTARYMHKLGHLRDVNEDILDLALKKGTNLVVTSDHHNSLQLYRVQEQKQAGRLYPGTGVGVVILNPEYEVVLQLRGGTTNNRKGKWDLPGGTVEKGDTLEDTVVKETGEETGLIVEPLGCVAIMQDMVEGQHWINYTFAVKVIGGKLENKEPYKFDDVKYFSMKSLPERTAPLAIAGIKAYQECDGIYIPIKVMHE